MLSRMPPQEGKGLSLAPCWEKGGDRESAPELPAGSSLERSGSKSSLAGSRHVRQRRVPGGSGPAVGAMAGALGAPNP